jgi:hypothetical protein
MDDLNKVRDIFLSDVDDETRVENEQKINDWERSIVENTAYAQWVESDVTQRIFKKARESYIEIAMQLATNRHMSEENRMSLYARQDGLMFFIELASKDAKRELAQIQKDIQFVLKRDIQ